MEFYTYVLYSVQFDRIYVGQTNNLHSRLERHNQGKVKSTKSFLPWKIVHNEKFETRVESLRREKELKSHRGRSFLV